MLICAQEEVPKTADKTKNSVAFFMKGILAKIGFCFGIDCVIDENMLGIRLKRKNNNFIVWDNSVFNHFAAKNRRGACSG